MPQQVEDTVDEVDTTVYEFEVGDLARFKAGVEPNDQKALDTFIITDVVRDVDGSVRHYAAFGGSATDPEGVRMFRFFRPERIRPETRRHVLTHRHRPGNGLGKEEG